MREGRLQARRGREGDQTNREDGDGGRPLGGSKSGLAYLVFNRPYITSNCTLKYIYAYVYIYVCIYIYQEPSVMVCNLRDV